MKLKIMTAILLMTSAPAAFAASAEYQCGDFRLYLDGPDRTVLYNDDNVVVGEWNQEGTEPTYLVGDTLYLKWEGEKHRCEWIEDSEQEEGQQ